MSSRTSLEARTPQEPTGRCEDTADRLERQRREPPRSRAIENARGILHVEDREMTGTLDRLRARLPFPQVTAGVSAHRGIGDDPRDGARACLFGELSRLEADEQNLIESRSVSHDAGRRIHRVRGQWWAARRNGSRRERFPPPSIGGGGHPPTAPLRAGGLRIGLGERLGGEGTEADQGAGGPPG